MKAYSGIVQNLGKEAEKLKKTDPSDAKEIAAKQVFSLSAFARFIVCTKYECKNVNAFYLVLLSTLSGSVCARVR